MSIQKPTSKADLIANIKSSLGEPVIMVNVDDTQIDVRIEEAIDLFLHYHYEGTETRFLAHQLTADDKANGYITVPDNVYDVIRVLPFGTARLGDTGYINYHYNGASHNLMAQGVAGGYGTLDDSILTVFLSDQHKAYYDNILNHEDSSRFNKHTRRIFLDVGKDKIVPGNYIVYEAYMNLFAENNSLVWGDYWFRRYATALVKKQWGINLTKFNGARLFGDSVEINGQGILDEANREIEELTQELYNNYTSQPQIFIG